MMKDNNYTGDGYMYMRNIERVAQKKAKELRPRRRGLKRIGSHNVGVRQSSVDTYDV